MITFSLSVFKYLAFLASACSFWLAFLHILVTCSLKFSLLSMVMPSNLIDALPILIRLSSRFKSSRWHLSLSDFISFQRNHLISVDVSFSSVSSNISTLDSIAHGHLRNL